MILRPILHGAIALLALGTTLAVTACGENSTAGNSETSAVPERDPSEILTVGSKAPDFTVGDDAGNQVKLADLIGKQNVVLIFYPANETPGCTKQLCAARDSWADYQAAGVQVYGVNTAGAESHAKFRENHNFPFPLLADAGGVLTSKYGARGPLGIVKRTVYGINEAGNVVFAERGIPDTKEILAGFATP